MNDGKKFREMNVEQQLKRVMKVFGKGALIGGTAGGIVGGPPGIVTGSLVGATMTLSAEVISIIRSDLGDLNENDTKNNI